MSTRIYWVGDSTVAHNGYLTYPQTGLGQALKIYLLQEISVQNHAKNGSSTKSFLNEFRLSAIYDEIRKEDFLFIQFGHNDEKTEDPLRYTDSFGEYSENLERFVNVARNNGAHPILITPLYRRAYMENGQLAPKSHLDYPDAMKAVGKRLQVPVIDLCEESKRLLETTDPAITKRWFMNLEPGVYTSYANGLADNTHLSYEGAALFAMLIAKGLRELGGQYEALLAAPEKLQFPVML